MILKFLHIDGRTFSLDMNDDATIQQTKIALIYLYKLEYHALEFVINGRILNDDEIISRIGYFNSSYITFYEPALTDDIEEVPPYFGSIPQACNFSGAPPFNETDAFSCANNDISQQDKANISPFQEIENGNDQKYLKYIMEPSLIQESQDSDSNYFPVSFDGNEFKFSAKKKPTNFQKIYQANISTLESPIYPQNEIIQKTKNSVDQYYSENQTDFYQVSATPQNSHASSNTFNQNTPRNTNNGTYKTNFNDGNLPTYNLNNMNNFSFPNNFNNNTIAQPKKTQKTRPSRIARIDFNHPILNQQFNRYPFS